MKLPEQKRVLILLALTLLTIFIVAFWMTERQGKTLSLGMAMVAVNVSFGFIILYFIIKQLKQIRQILDAFGKGNYDVKIDIKEHGKESGGLGETFKAAAFKLKNYDLCMNQKEYQTTVLKEIAERTGSNLNFGTAAEIISGSLGQIIRYTAVAYAVFDKSGKLEFKCYLEEPVSGKFVDSMKENIIKTMETLTGVKMPAENNIKCACFGAIFDDENKEIPRSFFNLPLIISNNQLVGIVQVASKQPGFYNDEETSVFYSVTEHACAALSKIKDLVERETEKINSLLSAVNDGLIMINPDQEVAVINQAAKQILNISKNDGITVLDIMQALYEKFDFMGALELIKKSDKLESFPEFKMGNAFYKITGAAVKTKAEAMLGIVFLFNDVTEQKRIDQAKTEFISITSHQLRTPVSSIKWFLEMLINGDLGEIPDRQKSLLEDVYHSSERISELINDLLDITKMQSGKVTLEPTPTNLAEFIKSMLPEVAQIFKQKRQIFEFKKPDSLPRISIDPKLTWRVIENLLTNASKYTAEGGQIALELSIEKDDVLVKVTDNGIGIPNTDKHRIFEKFFRAENTSRVGGTGLGLYISREIVETSGGRLWFESEEDKGTTFCFTLPLSGSKRQLLGAGLLKE